MLSDVRRHLLFEGRRTQSDKIGTARKAEVRDHVRFTGELTVKHEEAAQWTLSDIFDHAELMAEQLGRQQAEHLFSRVRAESEEAGTTRSAHGSPLSAEIILEGIEAVQIDFDEYGRLPESFRIVVPSGSESQMEQLRRQFMEDQDLSRRLDELLARKYTEFRAREADRRLVSKGQ